MGEAAAQMRKRVLVVDDEEEILQICSTFLADQGYEVIAVKSAAECLAFLSSEFADIMLLDVNLPRVDGFKLLEMVKSDDRQKDMRIIMVSARRDEETVRDALRLGCDGFVVKPFKLKELAERIGFELFQINDADVRAILKIPMQVRTILLKETGLSDFNAAHWDSYPIKFKEMSLCVLMPRGVRPSKLAKALDEELDKKILVFHKHPHRWKRIWPTPAAGE